MASGTTCRKIPEMNEQWPTEGSSTPTSGSDVSGVSQGVLIGLRSWSPAWSAALPRVRMAACIVGSIWTKPSLGLVW